MDERSFARVEWRREQLGLSMLGPLPQGFFLYAEPLLMLFSKQYVLVKYADRHPERCIRRFGGEIWASLDTRSADVGVIRLYFVPAAQRMQHGRMLQLSKVVATQDYIFPMDELNCYKQVIETMLLQRAEYDRMKINTDTSPV